MHFFTAPSRVFVDTFERVNITHANITWSPPRPANGPLVYYILTVHFLDSDDKQGGWRNETVPGWNTAFQLQVQCRGRAYRVLAKIAAVTRDGEVEYTGPASQEMEKEMCVNSGQDSFSQSRETPLR